MTEPTTSPTDPNRQDADRHPVAARPGPTLETAETTAGPVVRCARCEASYPLSGPDDGGCPVCTTADPNAGGSPSAR